MIPLKEFFKSHNATIEDLLVAIMEMQNTGYLLIVDGDSESYFLEKENICYVVAEKRKRIIRHPSKKYHFFRIPAEVWRTSQIQLISSLLSLRIRNEKKSTGITRGCENKNSFPF
jgi:hypothetical protein